MNHHPKHDPLAHMVEILPSGELKLPVEDQTAFIDDAWIADRIGIKIATVRNQRFKRRRGLDHWLHIDPVMFGSLPRYRKSDVIAWLQNREHEHTQE